MNEVFIFPSPFDLFEKENSKDINKIYNKLQELVRELIVEAIEIEYYIKNRTFKFTDDNIIKNYMQIVKYKLKEIKKLQRTIDEAPTIPELTEEKKQNIKRIQEEINRLEGEIDTMNDTITDLNRNKLDLKQENTDVNIKLNNVNSKVDALKKRKKIMLDDEFYKNYIHEKELVNKKDIHRIDLNNNITYDNIIYNMKEDKKQKKLSNNKNLLKFKTDKIGRLSDDVKYNFQKTDNYRNAAKTINELNELESRLTENNKPANNNLEPFSNIDEYKIQYLSPDYKKIMLSDASCNELDPGFNESLNCNDSNYNKNDENIKHCMQRAWCEYRGLSATLDDNQTQSSEDKERYQDANEYYNLAVVDSINLTIGIFGVVFLILKNRNII